MPVSSVEMTAGIQGAADPYSGIFNGGADLAGIFGTAKADPETCTTSMRG